MPLAPHSTNVCGQVPSCSARQTGQFVLTFTDDVKLPLGGAAVTARDFAPPWVVFAKRDARIALAGARVMGHQLSSSQRWVSSVSQGASPAVDRANTLTRAADDVRRTPRSAARAAPAVHTRTLSAASRCSAAHRGCSCLSLHASARAQRVLVTGQATGSAQLARRRGRRRQASPLHET
jgi:hypothetical protein